LATRITRRNTEGYELGVLTNSAERGVVNQREYFDKDIATNTDSYYIVERGDYVYNPRVSSAAPVGPISKNKVGTGVMSPLYTVFRFQSDASDFFAHYFRSPHWHGYLRRVSNSGARHDRMAITNDDLMQMPIPTPSPREQQRIADCLGSLDDLIAAESRKLEALRHYKQGLIQQLFPQEGETVPRMRFPEFRNAQEWRPHKFGDFVVKSFYGTSAATSETGQYPVLRMGNMSEGGLEFSNLVYIDLNAEEFESFRLHKGDILLNRTNSRDLVGKVSIFERDLECITASYIVSFRLDESRIDPWFCNLMLNTQMLQSRIKLLATPSISQANINPATFRTGLDIVIPKLAEQQRIASCLSSLNQVLAAQSRKAEGLKMHQQGLLQQLFPSPEEESR
jgi:type I restriction enzyme S subunit